MKLILYKSKLNNCFLFTGALHLLHTLAPINEATVLEITVNIKLANFSMGFSRYIRFQDKTFLS